VIITKGGNSHNLFPLIAPPPFDLSTLNAIYQNWTAFIRIGQLLSELDSFARSSHESSSELFTPLMCRY
jgi:hypothetical protein